MICERAAENAGADDEDFRMVLGGHGCSAAKYDPLPQVWGRVREGPNRIDG
jgi:hypothetical protein